MSTNSLSKMVGISNNISEYPSTPNRMNSETEEIQRNNSANIEFLEQEKLAQEPLKGLHADRKVRVSIAKKYDNNPDYFEQWHSWMSRKIDQTKQGKAASSFKVWNEYNAPYVSAALRAFTGNWRSPNVYPKPDEPSYFADKIVVNIPADILEPPPDKVENNIFTHDTTSYAEALNKGLTYYLQYVPKGKFQSRLMVKGEVVKKRKVGTKKGWLRDSNITEKNITAAEYKMVDVPAHYLVVFLGKKNADYASKAGFVTIPVRPDYVNQSGKQIFYRDENDTDTQTKDPKLLIMKPYHLRSHRNENHMFEETNPTIYYSNLNRTGNYRVTKKTPWFSKNNPAMQKAAFNTFSLGQKIAGEVGKVGVTMNSAIAAQKARNLSRGIYPETKRNNKTKTTNKKAVTPMSDANAEAELRKQFGTAPSLNPPEEENVCRANECPANGEFTNARGVKQGLNNAGKKGEDWNRKNKGISGLDPEKETDLCKNHPNICDGSAGIMRRHMPQIREGDRSKGETNDFAPNSNFRQYLDQMGYRVSERDVAAGNMVPVQGEMNRGKSYGIAAAMAGLPRRATPYSPAELQAHLAANPTVKALPGHVLLSYDNGVYHVIDGHHRYAAGMIVGPEVAQHAVVIHAPYQDALRVVAGFNPGTVENKNPKKGGRRQTRKRA